MIIPLRTDPRNRSVARFDNPVHDRVLLGWSFPIRVSTLAGSGDDMRGRSRGSPTVVYYTRTARNRSSHGIRHWELSFSITRRVAQCFVRPKTPSSKFTNVYAKLRGRWVKAIRQCNLTTASRFKGKDTWEGPIRRPWLYAYADSHAAMRPENCNSELSTTTRPKIAENIVNNNIKKSERLSFYHV